MEFCGSPLWDWNLTWHSNTPNFTPCFQDTVLAWIPLIAMWLLAVVDLYFCRQSSYYGQKIPWNALNATKLTTTCVLLFLQLLLLFQQVYYHSMYDYIVYPVAWLTPVLRILTFGLVGFLILYCKANGVISSGVQCLFWFLLTLCELVAFRTTIEGAYRDPPTEVIGILVVKLVFYPLVICAFLLNCWADVSPLSYSENTPISQKICPEVKSSSFSRLIFFWFEGLVWQGYRKPLESADLWDLNPEDKSSALVALFEKNWHKSSQKVTFDAHSRNKRFEKEEIGSVKFEGHFKSNAEKNDKVKSILPTLLKVFGPTLLFGAFLKLLQDLLIFVSPQILKLLISFVENKDAANGDEPWKGYFYAVLLFSTAVVQTLLLNQYFHRMFLVGMRMRSTLVNVIYRKALIISSSARKESTVGEIVNLMSVDAQRFMDLITYVNMIWSGPLQISLALFFLWGTLGPSVLAGLGVMILMIPINAYIASRVETLQIKQMKQKDMRVKLMNEILSGIKVLKLYAWEHSFVSQVMGIRENEMLVLKHGAYLGAGTTFIWNCAPFLVAVSSFASFVLSDPKNILDPQTAFVALSLFNILRFPLSALPMTISAIVQAHVSLKRINKFMNAEEIDSDAVTHDASENDPIVIEKGEFSWDPKSETSTLRNIHLRVKEGSLVAICGTVGSGKSSLLSTLLGEMYKKSGHVNTKGSLAYVAQQAWIQNATVRDNILFGLPLERRKYDKVVNSCALGPDLEILGAGDKTEIGEKGINLSGGQKQRISLARATYSNADIYLLDDPLSAVDSHVGKHIFENVLGPKGLLKNKTRLLVTHGVTFLPQMDQIIVVKDGEITETGSYKELLNMKGAFADFLVQHLGSECDDENEASEIIQDLQEVVGVKIERQKSRVSESDTTDKPRLRTVSNMSDESENDQEFNSSRKRSAFDNVSPSKPRRNSSITKYSSPENEKLIQAETSETGRVKWSVYLHYLRAIGWRMTFFGIISYIVFQGLQVGSDMWLAVWSNSNQGRTANDTEAAPDQGMYLGVYAGLGIGQALGILTASVVLAIGGLRASGFLHLEMLERIMRAPMSFFDTVPIGRIVNRFGKDVDVCDNTIRLTFESFLSCFFNIASVMIVISYSTPIFLAVIFPIGILYLLIQRFYVATSRQLKRLESVSRSPIYSHFGETLTGCSTIRAYAVQGRFTLESEAKVDFNQTSYFPSVVSNRWLAVRLETIGNFIILFAALFAVIQNGTLTPGLVGLSITYALSITQELNWLVRMTSELETNIVAVERIQEYIDVVQEAEWENSNRKPRITWPEKGEILFENYETRYREGLDLVLRGITLNIKPSEKIGVVGRTGAGKSSLTLALFRIIESAGGSIQVDGENISKIGLHDLRSRLTIIPQDPVLFSGTLRLNLDPFNEHSDEVVWRALEHAHLKAFAKGLTAGLQYEVSEGGENLSVGQRQLICLARALLRKTKILILDEATAAVDLETDDLIQETIRKEFKDCTIITIAHRLNTIMDSMKVAVLDKGEVREFDSPAALLQNKDSIFYGMAKDAGLV